MILFDSRKFTVTVPEGTEEVQITLPPMESYDENKKPLIVLANK